MARTQLTSRMLLRDMGQSASFNGTTSTISVTHSSLLNLAQNGSIGCWVKMYPATGAGFDVMICKGTNESYELDYDQAARRYRLVINRIVSSYRSAVALTNTALINEWAHVVGTIDTVNGMLILYVNGQVAGSAAFTPELLATNTDALGIGFRSASNDRLMEGNLDQVFVYNHGTNAVLTQAQVQDIYYRGVYAKPSELAHIEYMNGNANDGSGNGNNGTASNVTWSNDVALRIRSAASGRTLAGSRTLA